QRLRRGNGSRRHARSVPFSTKNRGNRLQQNFRVECEAPVLDVLQIEMHVGFKGRIAPRSDLPESGETRLHVETAKILDAIELEIVERVWARAHQAHVAANHVDQLGKLVD